MTIRTPWEPSGYLMRAEIHKALKHHRSAFYDFTMAIILNRSASNYSSRGILLLDMQEYQMTNKDFNKSLLEDNNNAYTYFYRGASSLFLKKFDNAILDFSKAITYDSLDFDSFLGLAIAYFHINNLEKAKLNFEHANQILSIPQNIKTMDQYQNSYWYENNYAFFNNCMTQLTKLP